MSRSGRFRHGMSPVLRARLGRLMVFVLLGLMAYQVTIEAATAL